MSDRADNWTREDDSWVLETLHLPLESVARAIDRDPYDVALRRDQLAPSPVLVTPDAVARDYLAGVPIEMICTRYKLSHPTVYKLIREAGSPRRKRPWSAAEDAAIHDDTARAIGARFGRTRGAVISRRCYLRRRGAAHRPT